MIAAWVVAIAYIGWDATGPYPFRDGPSAESFAPPYLWQYPMIVFVAGLIIFALLRPWRDNHSFWGSAVAAILCFSYSVGLLISGMHSHPVHDTVALTLLFFSLCLLFYSGFSFARWQTTRKSRGNAV